MAEVRGRIDPTKDRLMALISASSASLAPEVDHVYPDWFITTYMMGNLPFATVRISPANTIERAFGRTLEGGAVIDIETGAMIIMNFTIHVHHNYNATAGQARAKYALDLADLIEDYLIAQSTEQTAYGISDIYDISKRESEPHGRKISRVIMSGKLQCKRYDA